MGMIVPVTVLSLVAHGLLFWLVRQWQARARGSGRALMAVLALSAITALTALISPEAAPAGLARGVALTLLNIGFGAVIVHDLYNRLPRAWYALTLLWVIALLAAVVVGSAQPDAGSNPVYLVLLGGVVVNGVALLVTTFYAYYRARLPETANRALYWVLDIALLLMGSVTLLTGADMVAALGLLLLLGATSGLVYAEITHRVFDIRSQVGSITEMLLLSLMTTAVIFVAMLVADSLSMPPERAIIVYVLIALVAALLYQPLRRFAELGIQRLLARSLTDPAEAARRYSQEVSKAVELDHLAQIATRTVSRVMGARRAGLVLVSANAGSDVVDLLLIADTRRLKGQIRKSSPVYAHLTGTQSALTQFDIEFSPDMRSLNDAERHFFHNAQMSAYAPILVENNLIGILACGPRTSDAPYSQRDLNLLTTMANQTGVALRNARLVADLRRLNEEMKTLNTGLGEAKDQLEKLDSVKTDFVTIASHELRTPLAQLRGFTDILESLNEDGALDYDQTASIVASLQKASERMDELITAMLDVSQIDVDAMNLRFAHSSVENIVRAATEPLIDVIKQRKLTLSARGLRSVPAIQADSQRLIQAFRNIVLNAIKFTPDGGRIEITASLQAADGQGSKDKVLIAIADTGVGIKRENLDLIFTKFYRGYDPNFHSTGSYKFMGAGPGLGLTIAKGVIEGHCGQIWAESTGHSLETYPGTTFYVLLPVSPPADAPRVVPFLYGSSEEESRTSAALASQA